MHEYDVFMRNVEGVTIRYSYEATDETEARSKAEQDHPTLIFSSAQLAE